ncbi:hypothetical protein [Maridesulfovibrio hydrothermalis]|uniref:Phage ABA sandwich domain-containing protein n=1 Tax=Maridesulfovibrio hydrothermalis AM13 = DSM 14728 TaxID=1121451 RepID=L0R8T2_9BACT|nr:hypothetical protein [Maridesulfovibrio hydrothermalis]CCO23169.1 conserved protein of unknown function [Maridesulfovibrio hydrothermalis AM13 = DSM 14728]
MAEYTIETLEEALTKHLGDELPENALSDIHQAIKIAEHLETRGYTFELKDLSRGSMTETNWRAILVKDGKDFAGESDHAALAVCVAAADALESE